MKRIAITVWQDRVSPVFDTSQWLRIFDFQEGKVDVRLENIGTLTAFGKAQRLEELAVDVLICGAITRPLHIDLISSGIDVIPFVCGAVDAVVESFLTHKNLSRFAMPGYKRQNRRRIRGASPGRMI